MCTLLLLLVGAYWQLSSTADRDIAAKTGGVWTPELEMIWRPFLDSDHPLLISLGTPLFTKMAGLFFRNPTINEWPEALKSEQLKLLQKDLQSDQAAP